MDKKLKIIIWILVLLLVASVVATKFISYKNSMLVKKPAIYLYPEEDSRISVRLEVNGEIVKDEPDYKNGWNVFVTKEGLIEGNLDYLFYEAKLNNLVLPNEGWIVKYDDLENWFDKSLPAMGLNEKETSQFKDYWLNELPESPYYEIKKLSDEFLDENMDLIIFPEPSTKIRVNLYFKPLMELKILTEPNIETPERKGLVVVEWGGLLSN